MLSRYVPGRCLCLSTLVIDPGLASACADASRRPARSARSMRTAW